MTLDCYISLGANLGERERSLRRALELLHGEEGVEVLRVSRFYETSPWGKLDQPPFVNAAAKLRTDRAPMELLGICQRIEAALGRVRCEHWGARTMDIDLLHIPGISMADERLSLPHPLMLERAFVLVPLAEIAPELGIHGKSVREHLASCKDKGQASPCHGSPMDLSLKLIACVDSNGGLGRRGELLFHLPEDMAFFRKRTWGAILVMGRRTMESLKGPLEGRRNLVLSSKRKIRREGFAFCPCLEDLWRVLFREQGRAHYVIGGGEVYRQLLPYCGEAFLTRVEAEEEADVFLPDLSGEFSLASCRLSVDEATGLGMQFCHYVRKRGERSGDFQE